MILRSVFMNAINIIFFFFFFFYNFTSTKFMSLSLSLSINHLSRFSLNILLPISSILTCMLLHTHTRGCVCVSFLLCINKKKKFRFFFFFLVLTFMPLENIFILVCGKKLKQHSMSFYYF